MSNEYLQKTYNADIQNEPNVESINALVATLLKKNLSPEEQYSLDEKLILEYNKAIQQHEEAIELCKQIKSDGLYFNLTVKNTLQTKIKHCYGAIQEILESSYWKKAQGE